MRSNPLVSFSMRNKNATPDNPKWHAGNEAEGRGIQQLLRCRSASKQYARFRRASS